MDPRIISASSLLAIITSLVQANSSTLVQVIASQRVADVLLNGRNVPQLLSLNAGVSDQNASASGASGSVKDWDCARMKTYRHGGALRTWNGLRR